MRRGLIINWLKVARLIGTRYRDWNCCAINISRFAFGWPPRCNWCTRGLIFFNSASRKRFKFVVGFHSNPLVMLICCCEHFPNPTKDGKFEMTHQILFATDAFSSVSLFYIQIRSQPTTKEATLIRVVVLALDTQYNNPPNNIKVCVWLTERNWYLIRQFDLLAHILSLLLCILFFTVSCT